MAFFQAEYNEAQTKQLIISGIPNKLILITRVNLSSLASAAMMLISDPNGAAERTLLVKQYSFASGFIEAVLGRRYGLAADRGKDVAVTTQVTGPNYAHSVTIWYEVVD